MNLDNANKDAERASRPALEQALRDAGAVFKGTAVSCPFHEDAHPSGNIYDKAGVWRFKCMTPACGFCGDVFDVRARSTGVPVEDQLKATAAPTRSTPKVYPTIEALAGWKGRIEASYKYTNPDTLEVELVVVRCIDNDGAKTFLQAHPVPGGYSPGGCTKPWPIYNRGRLRGAKVVIWVEGEKKVHALHELGIIATTSPGGSSNAHNADYRPMIGVEEVIIWPDHDPVGKTGKRAGMEYANEVAHHLQQLNPAPRLSIVDPAALGLDEDGSDVVDYLAAFDTVEAKKLAIKLALEDAKPIGAADDLYQQLEDTISGKRRSLAWPWREMSRLTKAFLPATITIICGAPGSSKSFMVLELAWWMHVKGTKVAILELEEDRAYHLQRVLAQVSNNADLTDPDWIREHPAETIAARDQHRTFLDGFAPCITASPDRPMTYREVVAWVKTRAEAGAQIIIVDPITAADSGMDKPWIADLKLITELKLVARTHAIPILLVSHPKKAGKSSGPPSLDDLAGGAAFQRFAQCIIWLNRPDKPKEVRISTDNGPFTATVNRIAKLLKVRNGPGAGNEIGFDFEATSLRFAEQGSVLKAIKSEAGTDDAAGIWNEGSAES